MTDEELDALARRVLLDRLRREWSEEAEGTGSEPVLDPSSRHRRQIRTMLADPWDWAAKRSRPLWKKAALRAASVLLVCTLSLGLLMSASSTARAAVLRWVVELYETHIVYRYSGESVSGDMPAYQITALPEGYVETDRIEEPGYVGENYKNQENTILSLDCIVMQQGSALNFVTDNVEVSEIRVGGHPGKFLLSLDPDNSNAVTWVDSSSNLQFVVDGFFDESDMIHIAESVVLENSPNL